MGGAGSKGMDYSSYLHLGSGDVLDFAVPAAETAINKAALPSFPPVDELLRLFSFGTSGTNTQPSPLPSTHPSLHLLSCQSGGGHTHPHTHWFCLQNGYFQTKYVRVAFILFLLSFS